MTPKSRPFQVGKGEVIEVQTAGAGGYGEPTERDLESVLAELDDGLLGKERAFEAYGVDPGPGGSDA